MRWPALTITLIFCASGPALAGQGQRALVDLERQIARQHPDAKSLTPEQFETRLAAGEPLLILDVRDEAEFNVSRLPGAIRVPPGITAAEFMAAHGKTVRGSTLLLYCSVGARSSELAARLDQVARDAGAAGVFNLLGGVFSWHNTGRRLETIEGATDEVHPYSRSWSRYIDFDNLTRYRRQSAP